MRTIDQNCSLSYYAHSMSSPSAALGRTLGHYRLVEHIGARGMGVVYRTDEHLDRDVAIKVLPPGTLIDEDSRHRFRKEALALAKLNHPNIETLYEFNSQDFGLKGRLLQLSVVLPDRALLTSYPAKAVP